MTVYNLVRNYRRAKKGQSREITHPTHYQFQVSTSFPPDTQLHVSGGTRWDYGTGGQEYEEQTVDLGDTSILSPAFTIGDRAYRAYVISMGEPDEWFFYTDGTEYTDAHDAEDALDAIPRTQLAWSQGIPVARVILRENGVGGVDAIDVVNRGRSYVF